MAYSQQSEVSDGTLQRVILSISFYDKADIHVYIEGRELSEAAGEYSWEGDVAVYLRDVVPAGETCMLRRSTDMSKLRLKFSEGVAFTRNNLDDQNEQFLHIGQEAKESAISDIYADVDMHRFRIRNAGDPVHNSDYTTRGWVDRTYAEAVEECVTSAIVASRAAAGAANSAEGALDSAIRAEAAAGVVGPQVREALRRSYAEVGLNLVQGSFEEGAVLNTPQDVLLQCSTGECFRWGGAFPKIVPANSDPYTTGGISPSGWISVKDVNLRDELTSPDGDKLIGSSLGGSIFSDYSPSEYIKSGELTSAGTVLSYRNVFRHTDGMWYSWTGQVPHSFTAGHNPSIDINWKCVGNLSGFALGDARNFGFIDGMDNASYVFSLMMNSPFYKFAFPVGSNIRINSDVVLRSNVSIDFQDSTIDWQGVKFSPANVDNGSEMAIINTPNFAGGTEGSLNNVAIKNLTVDANDYSIGLNLRNILNLEVDNVIVNKAQRQGINVSNCQSGVLANIKLKDCSTLPDSGFTEAQLESWGDGIIIWYGSDGISLKNIYVESGSSKRGGRGGIVVDGYAPLWKPDTRNIVIENAYVYGYDRPIHTELCGSVTVTNGYFEYNSLSDSRAFLKCSAVVWNTLRNTVFNNCVFRTDKRFMKNSGAKAVFNNCYVEKNSTTDTMFVTGVENNGVVEFNSCNISQAGGNFGAWNASLYFNNCKISSDSSTATIDLGGDSVPVNLTFNNTTLVNISVTATYAVTYSEIKVLNSDISGGINCLPSASLIVSNSNISGDVACGAVMRYNGQMPKHFGYSQNVNQQYNGAWLGTDKPTSGRPDGSGAWARGDRILNLDAVEGNAFEWVCVTNGTPGRWSVAGVLSGGS